MNAKHFDESARIEHVNAMPAPTWGWLAMNDAHVALPSPCEPAPEAVTITSEGAEPAPRDFFERALDAAEERYAHLRRPDSNVRAGTAAFDAAALSSYQEQSLALQRTYTPRAGFATGMGQEALSWMRRAAGSVSVLFVPPHTHGRIEIDVQGAPGAAAIAAADVVVGEGASLDLAIALDAKGADAPNAKETGARDAEGAGTSDTPCGVIGSSLRLFAGARSRVSIACVQTADDAFTALDDTGLILESDAQVRIVHTVLGADASYTGLAADIPGDNAHILVETNYAGMRSQRRDFNYTVRHRGLKGQSTLMANGVLAGESRKTMRGTIDLVHGCRDSEGSEHETVLLVDERVENKSIPVILCDEDDVAGNHGATIGHIHPDQLFYLQSRGISAPEAESLFVRSQFEAAAYAAPNAHIRAGVVRLARRLFPNFEEDLAEEASL